MAEAGLTELLQAGVHFGHQTRRWNPNMRRFIFGELDGIHIIDLLQTEALLENARRFAGELASGGGTVLFVGTKKQARDSIQEWAERCRMPYVNKRWLGGLLTNFNTMSGRIARLHELNGLQEEGKLELLPTKERMGMEAELAKLEFNLGGVRDMERLPDAVFVTDLKTEEIAVHEAARLRIPIIGLVDTNCDPTPVDYVIPGNDDAIRSCELIIGTIGTAVEEAASAWRVQEEKRLAEEMERRRKEEEERRKREEEEKARVEAEEAAKKAAEEEAAKAARDKAARAAGPVGEGTPSSSQAAGEAAPSPPPAAAAAPAAQQAPPAAAEKAPPAQKIPPPAPEKPPAAAAAKADAPAPAAPQAPPAPAEQPPAPEPNEAEDPATPPSPSDADASAAGDSVGGTAPEEASATAGGGGSPAEAGPAAETTDEETEGGEGAK
jgi:small subunit ribosomal protein S2